MVNSGGTKQAGALIAGYVVIALGTVVALAVLAAAAPAQATSEAWGHAVIVAVFAVLLPLRYRAARSGKPGAVRAVGIVAAVLLVVNVVEAALPGAFPVWMRIEMVVIAVLMAALVLAVRPWAPRPTG
jgi:hypothetical protein